MSFILTSFPSIPSRNVLNAFLIYRTPFVEKESVCQFIYYCISWFTFLLQCSMVWFFFYKNAYQRFIAYKWFSWGLSLLSNFFRLINLSNKEILFKLFGWRFFMNHICINKFRIAIVCFIVCLKNNKQYIVIFGKGTRASLGGWHGT